MLTDLFPAGVHLPLEPFRQPHEDAGIAALVDRVIRPPQLTAPSVSRSGRFSQLDVGGEGCAHNV